MQIKSLSEFCRGRFESFLLRTYFCSDENAKVKQVVINWQWPYQTQTTSSEEELAENDREDTQDGMNISNYSFDIVVTGTQVVPSTSNV